MCLNLRLKPTLRCCEKWAEAHTTHARGDWICCPRDRKKIPFSSSPAGIPKQSMTVFPLQIRQSRIARNLEGHRIVQDDIDYAFEYSGIEILKVNRYPTVSSCRRHRSPPSER